MTIQAWLIGEPPYQRQVQQGLLSNNLTALGNSQSTALQLSTDFNVFTTVSASTGCLLLGAQDTSYAGTAGNIQGPVLPADTMIITNHGSSSLSVYPQGTGKIANGSAGAAFAVASTKTATFTYIGSGNWAGAVSA